MHFNQTPILITYFVYFPIRIVNQFLALLPGLFIIGGIFGTFLGIVKGIPELKELDPTNVESARLVLNHFLDQMAFSMNTSIMGIFFFCILYDRKLLFSSKSLQADAFQIYSHSLEYLYKNAKSAAGNFSGNSNNNSGNEGGHGDVSNKSEQEVKPIIAELITEEQRKKNRVNEIKKIAVKKRKA